MTYIKRLLVNVKTRYKNEFNSLGVNVKTKYKKNSKHDTHKEVTS